MPVRIALIGADEISRAVAETLQSLDEARLVAVCAAARNDIEYSKTETLARRVKARAFRDVKTLLRDETPDALCVVATGKARRDVEFLGMQNGLDIFLAPPFSTSTERAQTLIQCAAQSRSRLWISHHERFSPSVEHARKWLTAKNGAPLSCHGSWRLEGENRGAAVLESSTRLISLLRFLLGDIKNVYARASSGALALNIEFVSGTVGAFVLDSCSENRLHFADKERRIAWRETSLSIVRGQETQHIEYSNQARREELRLWVQSVESGRRTLQKSSVQDSLQTLRVALALQQSAKTNKPVRLK